MWGSAPTLFDPCAPPPRSSLGSPASQTTSTSACGARRRRWGPGARELPPKKAERGGMQETAQKLSLT
eukprot:3871727-Alexandrium_andersonii.AAC.1